MEGSTWGFRARARRLCDASLLYSYSLKLPVELKLRFSITGTISTRSHRRHGAWSTQARLPPSEQLNEKESQCITSWTSSQPLTTDALSHPPPTHSGDGSALRRSLP